MIERNFFPKRYSSLCFLLGKGSFTHYKTGLQSSALELLVASSPVAPREHVECMAMSLVFIYVFYTISNAVFWYTELYIGLQSITCMTVSQIQDWHIQLLASSDGGLAYMRHHK